MLPIPTGPDAVAIDALASDLDGLSRLADAIELPTADLEGWVSLCAEEYRAAVHRLAVRLDALRSALNSARRALRS